MNTVKVDLPDGNTAEFYADIKHKTQRAVEEVTRAYLTYPEGAGKLKVSQEDGGGIKTKTAVGELEVTVDLARIDWTAVKEIIILNQVASWSFGEVTAAVLGEQSEAVFGALKKATDKLYEDNFPLQKSGGAN
jgi:hypothetical protein